MALLGVAILPALILLVLAVPITVAFRVARVKATEGHLRFRWLFGLVNVRINLPGAVRPEPKRKRQAAAKPGDRSSGGNARLLLALLKQSAFRRRTARFIKEFLRAIRGRGLYLRLRIGLGDPADTGRLWAFLGPVAGIASNLRGAEISLEPEFMDPVVEVESHGELSLVPLQCIALAVAFAASPATVQAWRTVRRSKAGALLP